jgi:hypothetical protein
MPNWKKVIVSGSAANLSSLSVDTSITASVISATEFTGSLFGTASQAISSSYSLYALTASYALNGGGSTPGVGSSVLFTQATASTSWVFVHNLGGTYVTTDVYDSSDNIIIPQNITATNENTLTITFGVPTSGHAVATVGGGLPAISSSYADYILAVNQAGTAALWVSASGLSVTSASYATTASYASTVGFNFQQVSPSSTWTINHNLNNQHPLVQIYDSSHLTFIPQSISGSSANTVVVTFSTAVTGYARVV